MTFNRFRIKIVSCQDGVLHSQHDVVPYLIRISQSNSDNIRAMVCHLSMSIRALIDRWDCAGHWLPWAAIAVAFGTDTPNSGKAKRKGKNISQNDEVTSSLHSVTCNKIFGNKIQWQNNRFFRVLFDVISFSPSPCRDEENIHLNYRPHLK